MSYLLERCKACVDKTYIDWDKTRLSTSEKNDIQEYMAWGIIELAMYILDFKEYNEFKQYIYDKHGYDPGGVVTGQMNLLECEVFEENENFKSNTNVRR